MAGRSKQIVITDAKQALLVTRLVWGAMLIAQVVFMVIALSVREQRLHEEVDAQRTPYLFYVALAFLIGSVPLAMIIRRVVYGPSDGVPPARYFAGNVVFLSMLEAVSMFGIVSIMVDTPPMPGLIVPLLAMAVQAIHFPTGRAMRKG